MSQYAADDLWRLALFLERSDHGFAPVRVESHPTSSMDGHNPARFCLYFVHGVCTSTGTWPSEAATAGRIARAFFREELKSPADWPPTSFSSVECIGVA